MLLYFIVLINIIFCNAVRTPNRRVGRYDQIVLCERSPIAAYYEVRKEWPTENISPENSGLPNNTCAGIRTPSHWFLRGLWPNKLRGASPVTCKKRVRNYVSSFINETLKGQLDLLWPNFYLNKEPKSFYEAQWHRHGSCVTDAKGMGDVEGYFNTALKLLNNNNIGRVLENEGIVPGNSYSLQVIFNLIRNVYSIEPRVKCLKVKNSEQQEVQYLLEVTLCFNKRLKIQDCIQNGFHSTCDPEKSVIYATITKA